MTEALEDVGVYITKAWMKHLGYSDERLTELMVEGCHSDTCEFDGQDWTCFDEYGESHHPDYDELNATAELVFFVLMSTEAQDY